MSFKLRNINEVFGFSKEYSTGDYKVVEKNLGKNTLGTINPNGVIEIEENMSKALKRKAVKHELDHLRQMKSGELRFDHNNYYYKADPFSQIQVIPNSQINTNDRDLPWEKDAHH